MRWPGRHRRNARHHRGAGVPSASQPSHRLLPGPAAVTGLSGRFHRRPRAKDDAGVVHDRRQVLSGESWVLGQVVLSWADVLAGAAIPDDGRNVVIHEFAHQLDQQKGHANGAPILAGRRHYRRWSRVLGEEYSRLQEQARGGQATLLNHYGATNPAEFFAVISEIFFEQPMHLAGEHPALYRELSRFYRVDPLSW